jgi:hypothetical protein
VRKLLILPVVLLLASCAAEAPPAPPAELTATLVSPLNITLNWRADDPAAAGRVVEFATEEGGQYTTLLFATPQQTTFTHPDLIPDTSFYYRVRTYFGPATEAQEITLPLGDLVEESGQEWVTPKVVPGSTADTTSIRGSGGAPTDLRATVMHANGIKFTWTDHASDEDGYLIEVRRKGSTDFTAAMALDPDINSTGLITLPEEKQAEYRVRAFYYGKTTNLAHQKTGADPAGS